MPDLPLTSGELVGMRHTINTFLSGTAILYTVGWATNSAGGQVDTATAAGTYSARLAPMSGDEMTVAERQSAVNLMVLTLPAYTTVTESGRITYNSRSYEVERVLTRTPEEISRRVVVTEVR